MLANNRIDKLMGREDRREFLWHKHWGHHFWNTSWQEKAKMESVACNNNYCNSDEHDDSHGKGYGNVTCEGKGIWD